MKTAVTKNSGLFLRSIISLSIMSILFLTISSCNPPVKQSETEEADVQDLGLVHPDWSKNANIYEVNIRQYTQEGTFTAFEEHLPRLQKMGVKILWLMPVFPIGEKNRKGTLGSYYAIKDYTAVNPEFGTMDEFKSMVRKAHEMGFKVILDWVANHTAWDHPWITQHPEWYTTDSTGQMISPADWTDVADLNYDDPGLRDAMMDALKFWVKETDIDGYRCDVAGMVPVDFWNRVRKELDQMKPVFMLAEAENTELHEKAFDMTYAWELHHIYNSIAKGEKNANDLENYFKKQDTTYPSDTYRMDFITNHDENSWNGTVGERLKEGANTFAMLTFTLPGMPLIYSGQEEGLNKRLEFFEKDPIQWNPDSELIPFYTRLLHLKTNNEALWNGDFGGVLQRIPTNDDTSIFAFVREKDNNKIFVIANLSGEARKFQMTGDESSGNYKNVFTGEDVSYTGGHEMELKPWEYFIYIAQ